MMMWGYNYMEGWFGMMFILLLLLGLVIFAVFKLFLNNGTSRHNNSAIDILDEKFASGEISEEEYRKRKSLLKE